MELFLLSNGKLSGESELLGYAKSHLLAMIARRGYHVRRLYPICHNPR